MATVLEGALLGALDTSYIAKRTALGISIALAIIYTSQNVFHVGLIGIWVPPSPHFLSAVLSFCIVLSNEGLLTASMLIWLSVLDPIEKQRSLLSLAALITAFYDCVAPLLAGALGACLMYRSSVH